MYSFVGATPPADTSLFKFEGSTTRTMFKIQFPPTVAGEGGDPDPGQHRHEAAEQFRLDDVVGLLGGRELAHERPADRHTDDRDQEDRGVAQGQRPPLVERVALRKRDYRQDQKRCAGAYL